MVKRIVYRTKISVYDMILDECKKINVPGINWKRCGCMV